MVASIRNISAKGVTVGQYVAPPAPQEITAKVTSGTMTYWSTYNTSYSPLTALGSAFNPSTLGSNGTLSNSDLTVGFSGEASVLGATFVATGNIAWEFEVNTDYYTQVGYFQEDATPFNPNGSSQTDGYYYQSNGALYSTNSGILPASPYTTGDIIGVVFNYFSESLAFVHFFKNGVLQGSTYVGAPATGAMMVSCVTASPPPAPTPQDEWWGSEGQTDPYSYYGGPLTSGYFYRKTVTRAAGGTVISETINSNATPPTLNWSPHDSDPQPIITLDNGGLGRWLVDIGNQTVDPAGGGGLQVVGDNSQILSIGVNWSSDPPSFNSLKISYTQNIL